jgi:hypothetical protein
MAITETTQKELVTLIVGMFNASPGGTVLSDLVNAYNAGSSIEHIAQNLTQTAAFKSIYPDFQTNLQFVTNFVNTTLGGLVPADDKQWAIDYLVSEMTAGATKAQVIIAAVTALLDVESDDPVWGAAADMFRNKVEVANYHTVDLLLDGDSLAALQAVLAGVTNDPASVVAAKGAFDASIVVEYSLVEALAQGASLRANYSISDDVLAAGNVSVAAALGAFAAVSAVLAGAQNSVAAGDVFTWSIVDSAANVLANAGAGAVTGADAVSVTDSSVTLVQADALVALSNFDGNLPSVVYTLEQASTSMSLYDPYMLDAGAQLDVGAVMVADAIAAYGNVAGLVADAENAGSLTVETVFAWSIADSASEIIVNAASVAITNADVVTVTDGSVTVADAAAIYAANQNSIYDIEDSAAGLFSSPLNSPAAVGNAQSVTVTSPLTAAQAAALYAVNTNSSFDVVDTVANIFNNDGTIKTALVAALGAADSLVVQGTVTAAQAGVLVNLNANVEFDGFTLSIGADNLTGDNGVDNFFYAPLDSNIFGTSSNTLQPTDSINGGTDSTNTLVGTVISQGTNVFGTVAIDPNVQNVQNIFLTATGDTGQSNYEVLINAYRNATWNMKDVKEWWSIESDADLRITNATLNTAVGMDSTAEGVNYTVNFRPQSLTGDDAVTVVLNNVGNGEEGGVLRIGSTTPGNGNLGLSGIETFNVLVGASSSWLEALETSNDRLTNVTVSESPASLGAPGAPIGSATENTVLEISENFNDLTLFDAEGFVGQIGSDDVRMGFNYVGADNTPTGSTFEGDATILGSDGGNVIGV